VRTSHRARAGNGEGELKITPLIDAVFLLLTYFLFTISLSTIEGLLPSQLALGDDFQEQRMEHENPDRQVIVRIVQTGERVQYFLDDWPVSDFAAVSHHLDSMPKDSTVVIDADANVAYDNVVRLYNHCLKLSLKKVVFPLSRTAAPGSAPRL
jgi:biopolymer transport protein ExbD